MFKAKKALQSRSKLQMVEDFQITAVTQCTQRFQRTRHTWWRPVWWATEIALFRAISCRPICLCVIQNKKAIAKEARRYDCVLIEIWPELAKAIA